VRAGEINKIYISLHQDNLIRPNAFPSTDMKVRFLSGSTELSQEVCNYTVVPYLYPADYVLYYQCKRVGPLKVEPYFTLPSEPLYDFAFITVVEGLPYKLTSHDLIGNQTVVIAVEDKAGNSVSKIRDEWIQSHLLL